MISDLSFAAYAARLRDAIQRAYPGTAQNGTSSPLPSPPLGAAERGNSHASINIRVPDLYTIPGNVSPWPDDLFNEFALSLFRLQFAANAAYRRFCEFRKVDPVTIASWREIPTIATAAFKEGDLTCLALEQRERCFFSSGTTEQRPSRHFHHPASLDVYESSLRPWFFRHLLPEGLANQSLAWLSLTPPPASAPHSSLVHMFETVAQELNGTNFDFAGEVLPDGSWSLRLPYLLERLSTATIKDQPLVLLGTAFGFVHLLDHCQELGLKFKLPTGSRVLETGGYKGRSRVLPKDELHALICAVLGIPRENLVSEYGMSELSSQAYDTICGSPGAARCFHFPPWARVRIISPETGREVSEGETGLIQIFDLANVASVLALQTEDLGLRRGAGFELLGRAQLAEPRGCSLMST